MVHQKGGRHEQHEASFGTCVLCCAGCRVHAEMSILMLKLQMNSDQ